LVHKRDKIISHGDCLITFTAITSQRVDLLTKVTISLHSTGIGNRATKLRSKQRIAYTMVHKKTCQRRNYTAPADPAMRGGGLWRLKITSAVRTAVLSKFGAQERKVTIFVAPIGTQFRRPNIYHWLQFCACADVVLVTRRP